MLHQTKPLRARCPSTFSSVEIELTSHLTSKAIGTFVNTSHGWLNVGVTGKYVRNFLDLVRLRSNIELNWTENAPFANVPLQYKFLSICSMCSSFKTVAKIRHACHAIERTFLILVF